MVERKNGCMLKTILLFDKSRNKVINQKMKENELSIIYSAIKNFCGNELNTHERISAVSQLSTELYIPTFFTEFIDRVITIDNVTS
jgi:hypothetical protein